MHNLCNFLKLLIRCRVIADVMKTLLLTLSLAAAGVSSSHAQLYSPTVTRSAVLGGIAGAFIGGHNHDRWAEGAIIGATAGALLGAAVEQPQPRAVVYSQPQVVTTAPYVSNCQPAQVVYVTNPPVQYVRVAPAPQVVYVNGCAPVCAPRYVPRAPVVVVTPRGHHRPQAVVYTRNGWRRD